MRSGELADDGIRHEIRSHDGDAMAMAMGC
jgi:hypothetical protein